MMYQIIIKKKAKKFIGSLPMNERRRVVAAIERLPDGEDIRDSRAMTIFSDYVLEIIALSTPWTMES